MEILRWVGRPYESVELRGFTAKVNYIIDYWFSFLAMSGIEPTSNRTERALLKHVVQRKIMYIFGNRKSTGKYEKVLPC